MMFFPIEGSCSSNEKEEDGKCGDFERNQEICGRMIRCTGLDNFMIRRHILSKDDYDLMRVAHSTISITGAKVYAARPYTSDIGQMKIYSHNGKVSRCRIRELYTNNHHGQLVVRASIILIDEGDAQLDIPFSSIYDFPQRARYLSKLGPEILLCSLDLPEHLLNDDQLKELFLVIIKKHGVNDMYTIKLSSHKGGKYYVDLLNSHQKSIIDYFTSRHPKKFSSSASIGTSTGSSTTVSGSQDSLNADMASLSLATVSNTHFRSNSAIYKVNPIPKLRRYSGALHYFKYRAMELERDQPHRFLMLKRFHEVKLTIWDNPDDIYLIPRDPEYFKSHQDLLDDIKTYVEKYELEKDTDNTFETVYTMSERVLWRNHHVDNIGTWLRGVITEVPQVRKVCWTVCGPNDSDDKGWYMNKNSPPKSTRANLRDFVYRIKSIDYGFEMPVSVNNIRKANDKTIFTRRGSYSLRCRLFGISPLSYNFDHCGRKSFSETCNIMIDAWMREKIVQEHRPSHFHVLFRSKFKSINREYQSADGAMQIVLFHRFEPPKTLEDMYLPLRRRQEVLYDCLNTFLVNNGYVTDEVDGMASKVDLDHLLMNMLANRDLI